MTDGLEQAAPLSLEDARATFDYDARTGTITWRKRLPDIGINAGWNRRYAGKPASLIENNKGYPRVRIGKRLVLAHRLAWYLCESEWAEGTIDHINVNKHDNRRANLRLLPRSLHQSISVHGRPRGSGSSGHYGLSIRTVRDGTKRYLVRLSGPNVTRKSQGTYATIEEAIAERDRFLAERGDWLDAYAAAVETKRLAKRTEREQARASMLLPGDAANDQAGETDDAA
jgi:HNH endonuclease